MSIASRVRYVPAAGEGLIYPSTLYTKYQTNESTGMQHSSMITKIKLPDRNVVFARGGSKATRPFISKMDFDEVVDVNSVDSHGCTTVLVNAWAAPKYYKKLPFKNFVNVICDSGGFQLVKGIVDGIDLEAVTDYYNRNATIGAAVEPHYFDRVTAIMKANDDFMLQRLEPHVDLAMISHGTTLAIRLKRLKALERKCDTLAIAALKVPTDPTHKTTDIFLNAVSLLVGVIQAYPDKKYYHCLGETSNFWLFIYAYMVGSGLVKNDIGGDSVTHLRNGMVGAMKTSTIGEGFKIERSNTIPLPLPCGCPVCRTVTDSRIMLNSYLLSAHNLWALNTLKNNLCESVSGYFKGTQKLSAIVKTYLPQPMHEVAFSAARYLDKVAQSGYYEYRLPKSTSLFKKEAMQDKHKQRFDKIMTFYETYHGRKFK